jgi:hypothetical protein
MFNEQSTLKENIDRIKRELTSTYENGDYLEKSLYNEVIYLLTMLKEKEEK